MKHAALYLVIEKFIAKASPALDTVYRWPREFFVQRLTTNRVEVRCRSKRTCARSKYGCTPMARPTQDDEPRRLSDEEPYSDSEVWNSEGDDNESNAVEDESNLEEDKLGSLHKEDKLSTPVLHARVSESEYETEEYDSAEDRVVGKQDDEEASGPEEEEEEDEDGDDERDITHVSENEVKRRDWQWFYKTHPVAAPEPSTAPQLKIHPEDIMSTISPHGIHSETRSRRLQVIVKLASIHLSPDDPTYDGGSWHVEGQLNEHICATALFYYDNENITA